MNLTKLQLNRFLASATLLAFAVEPVLAADKEGSLDTLWKDQPSQSDAASAKNSGASENTAASDSSRDLAPYQPKNGEVDTTSANPTPLDRGQTPEAASPSPETGAPETKPAAAAAKKEDSAAGGCQLEGFLHSNIVAGTSWPNVGPFKTTTPGPYSLVDGSRNRLGLAVQDNKVIAAELDLAGGANAIESFANLEMAADFLMEALGTKPKKINEINGQLEANTAVVNGTFVGPIGLICDPYLVMLNKGDSPLACKIRASNKQVPGAESAEIAMAEAQSAPAPISLAAPPTPRKTLTPKHSAAADQTPPESETPNTGASPSKYDRLMDSLRESAPPSTGPRGLAGARTEGRKQEFLNLIQAWQRLKKTAVRQRDVADLPQLLSGAALARQSNAIKWLAANHKYYDMSPKGAQIDRIEEQTPDQKYYVYAQVKESSKYVEENTGQVIKDSDETYNVRYTMEKSGDHWVIDDSALIKPSGTAPPAATKPAAH